MICDVFCTLFLKLNFFFSRNGGSDEAKTTVQVLDVLFHTLEMKIQYSSYRFYVYDYPLLNVNANEVTCRWLHSVQYYSITRVGCGIYILVFLTSADHAEQK